jgi:acyl-coenzyme A synthetase/AMP-(fatty) acid ligase
VCAIEGVRHGGCPIVDLPGGRTPHLALLVELRDGHGDFEAIAAGATRIATAKAGVRLSECVFLEKGALPKTPTGKVQRFRCRDLLLRDELPVLAAWRAPRAGGPDAARTAMRPPDDGSLAHR